VVLSLNNNKLTLLPPGLWRLKNLRSLNIAGTTILCMMTAPALNPP
jgi:Leucine-rich repeat (LRR) protein